MEGKRSQLWDEEVWTHRLQADLARLRERIGQQNTMAIGTFLGKLNEIGIADFLVVYGKAAREGLAATDDIDFYFETAALNENDPDATIEVDEIYDSQRFHALETGRGRLLGDLRDGRGFAFGLVRDAVIFVDRGPYQEALAALDEEQLALAPGESMDKPE